MSGKYIPSVTRNPIRLALSLLFSNDSAARTAVLMAAAGVLCWPLNKLLSIAERSILKNDSPPALPMLVVCGPPRSGTTLIAQYLINALDVCYLNNLTSIFPDAPLTVNSLWGARSVQIVGSFDAYYGRSTGLRGYNDALYIWDRWLGSDRSAVPTALRDGAAEALPAFFGALERLYRKPVVAKNNRLNTCADLVAPLLPGAVFLFVERDPVWLAQSLYIARDEIGGDLESAYGVQHEDAVPGDPVADVCAQVRFHQDATARTIERMPPNQALRVRYEEFCARPKDLIEKLAAVLGHRMPTRRGVVLPASFHVSKTEKLPADILLRFRQEMGSGYVSRSRGSGRSSGDKK